MARELFYRQCVLTRPSDKGHVRTTTWIPERKNGIDIEPGVKVTLKKHGSGSNVREEDAVPGVWTVESVGTQRHPEKRVKERAHNWQKYRAATDV